jgi:biopolymer transport protein TolQ
VSQISVLDLLKEASPLTFAVLLLLLVFSVVSWAIIFSKWNSFRQARNANSGFLRGFRDANGLEAAVAVGKRFRQAPLTGVLVFGFEELDRQLRMRGKVANKAAVERSLQLGIGEEVARLERHMSWLATTASVSPFIGLFGTVLGIISSFNALGHAGSASLRAVAPGMSEALVATAAGLAAAIPAAIFYNYFGYVIREMGARMEDFSLEFMNLTERHFEE